MELPKTEVKVGMVQMSMSTRPDANLRRAMDGVKEASEKGADIVCLPELFAWRYFPTTKGSTVRAEPIPGPASRAIAESARENKVVVVGGSIYEKAGGKTYNTCLVFDEEGRRVSKYRKVHIPQDEHYFEQDYFSPGKGYAVAKTSRGRVGSLICFDQWYPEAARVNRLMGADIIFYPTAIGWVEGIEPVEGDWKEAWEKVQVGHAIANSVAVCAVNRVGTEGATTFWGGSFLCDQFGKVLFRAGDEEGVFVVPFEPRLSDIVEEGWGFMRNRAKGTYSRITR